MEGCRQLTTQAPKKEGWRYCPWFLGFGARPRIEDPRQTETNPIRCG